MTINHVIDKYFDRDDIKITMKMLKGGPKSVLIEESKDSLIFLSELLAAVGEGGDYISLHPRAAGSAYFSQDSQVGLYLNCTKT